MKRRIFPAVILIFCVSAVIFCSCIQKKGAVQKAGIADDFSADTQIAPAADSSEPETTYPEATAAPETTAKPSSPQTEAAEKASNISESDNSLSTDSLFIGDSRTVGLNDYADLGSADIFAASGLNIFRILTETVTVPTFGGTTLPNLLASRDYTKIYIMLGLNEIGYNHTCIINKYAEVIDYIKTAEPEAKIIIQANLHITSERSSKDSVYNNKGLDEINEGLKALADGDRVKYIDANPIFDDKSGGLDAKYAVDDFHLKAEYYRRWGEWIKNNGK